MPFSSVLLHVFENRKYLYVLYFTENELNAACTNDIQCADENSFCGADKKCQCDLNFFTLNNTCEASMSNN